MYYREKIESLFFEKENLLLLRKFGGKKTLNWPYLSRIVPWKFIFSDLFIILNGRFVPNPNAYPWEWEDLSNNLTVTINDINQVVQLYQQEEFSFEIEKIKHKARYFHKKDESYQFPWDWYRLSKHTTWEIVKENLHLPWDWDIITQILSPNHEIAWGIIQENKELPWSLKHLGCHFPLSFIFSHPEIEWDWGFISENENLTWEVIKANPHRKWDFFYISRMPNLRIEHVLERPELHWLWNEISFELATLGVVFDHPKLPWVWESISSNLSITLSEIVSTFVEVEQSMTNESTLMTNERKERNRVYSEGPNTKWCWNALSVRFPLSFIFSHPELPWTWKGISCNPEFTFEILRKNLGQNLSWWNILNNMEIIDDVRNPNTRVLAFDSHSCERPSRPIFVTDLRDRPSRPKGERERGKEGESEARLQGVKTIPLSFVRKELYQRWGGFDNVDIKIIVNNPNDRWNFEYYENVRYKEKTMRIVRKRMRLTGISFVNWY